MEKQETIYKLIQCIENEINRIACKKLYEDNKLIFEYSKGSQYKHQAWVGGYLDHIIETMNIATVLHHSLSKYRTLPFLLSDALVVLFLHDLEKPWKYSQNIEKIKELEVFANYQDFISAKIKEYHFKLNVEQINALKYIHGEGKDHNPRERIQGPLAAFVHNCDVTSARIWFDHPKK